MDYPYDLGPYCRPVTTTSAEAQRWFDRGLNWCFSLALAEHSAHQLGSTDGRRAGIPMQVHPIPRESLKLRNSSLPGPDRMDNLMRAHS